jgi:hypothetical protein
MINKYNYSVENIYYIIFILFGIFIIALSLYYIVMTLRFKHTAMVEKFVVNKEHPDNPNFRQCQVYFLNDIDGITDIAKCDREYKKNPETTTCKYVYDGWQERADEVDENNNKITYKNKIFRNGKFDKRGIVNLAEDTRCFKELTDDISPGSNDNIHVFGNTNYLFQEFSISDRLTSGGCDIKFPVQRTIKSMKFYKFILDTSNKIIDVKKVNIKPDEMGFEIDTNFNISTFTSGQSYGIEYLREDSVTKKDIFRIFQISTFPPKPVNIHTFKYNYICDPNTQVIHKNQINAQLNIGSFIKFDESSSSVEYSFATNLPCNCKTFQWTDFANSDPKKREDKRQLIIDKLIERRTEITDEINASLENRRLALEKERDDIKTQEGCDITCLNQFKDNNKKITDILTKIYTTNKISSYKNEFKYIKKEADMSNRVYDDIIIKVKNTFAPGLTKYVIDYQGTLWESMVIFDESILTKNNNKSKDDTPINDFTKLSLNKNKINYFTGYFHAPTTGNYKFRISANTSQPPQPTQLTTFSLFLNNKRELFGKVDGKPVGNGETNAISFLKGDIVKIDIYFTSHPQDVTYMFGWKISSNSNYNNKSTSGRNVPAYFHRTESINNNNIPTSGDGTDKYVEGRFLMTPRIIPDETGDYYYVFKETDLQYGIEIKKGILCDILVVGGGGSGGTDGGGGGGGGEVKYSINQNLNGTYTINVGSGGKGIYNTNIAGNSGNTSSIIRNGVIVLSSAGGGGGGGRNTNGASGGGGGGGGHGSVYIGGSSTGIGGIGGNSAPGNCGGGGGGGANVANKNGGNASSKIAGSGGAGINIDITRTSIGYGGGGAGGTYLNIPLAIGTHGGGNGGTQANSPTNGEDGKGGGGGGGGYLSDVTGSGGNGGSGIVIIRVKMTGETIVSSIDFSKQNVLA